MQRIADRILRTTGIDVTTLGVTALDCAARQHMRQLGIADLDRYRRVLDESRAEWSRLVESLLITESWFFREEAAFAALGRLAAEAWPRKRGRPLRLLSLACARGEEPYSMVMALLDRGLPRGAFLVDAVDLSAVALHRAKQGLYSKNAFRTRELSFRYRYFAASNQGFVLDPRIRRLVRFRTGNLLDGDCYPGQASHEGCYDYVFCRNVLIYFGAAAQQQALSRIRGLLSEGGMLFVSSAEFPLAVESGFQPAELPLTFACRKPLSAPILADVRKEKAAANGQPAPGTGLVECPSALPAASARSGLQRIRSLVDAGRLEQATLLCEAHLRRARHSAEGWYLLGRARAGRGATGAQECYRKALYLEPHHYEALLQLAALAQSAGDTAAAANYRRRAQCGLRRILRN